MTKRHKAHILVAVLADGGDIKEKELIYTKIMAACSRQENAIGVFTSGVVFEPDYYIEASQMMKEETLPIFNWIWFGLYQGETIGFSKKDKHKITWSKGVALPEQDTLKISYSIISEQEE